MTIVVMFGIIDQLNLHVQNEPSVARAAFFSGQNDDQFWVVEDKEYGATCRIGLPAAFPRNPGPLAVLLHNSSVNFHVGQIEWLKQTFGSNTYKVGSFSHCDKGSIADTIRKWATCSPSTYDVSAKIKDYDSIVGLSVVDELAAWHLLVMATNESNSDYVTMRDEVLERGDAFVSNLKLLSKKPKEWLDCLQKKAEEFCCPPKH